MAFKLIKYDLWEHDIYREIACNAIELLKKNKNMCLFSMDKTHNYVSNKMISEYLNIDFNKLLNKEVTDAEIKSIMQFGQKFEGQMVIFDYLYYTLEEIDKYITELIAENKKPDLVVIDNINDIDFYGKLKVLYKLLDDLQNKFDIQLIVYQEKGLDKVR